MNTASNRRWTASSPELAWLGTETNHFGTDEFMKWCEVVGTEPYLCFNFGTGTLDEGMLGDGKICAVSVESPVFERSR